MTKMYEKKDFNEVLLIYFMFLLFLFFGKFTQWVLYADYILFTLIVSISIYLLVKKPKFFFLLFMLFSFSLMLVLIPAGLICPMCSSFKLIFQLVLGLVVVLFTLTITYDKILVKFNLKKKCLICNKEANDSLWIGKEKKRFCRKHLIQEFENAFDKSSSKIIAFYPDLETKKGDYIYRFYTVKEIKKYYSNKRNPQNSMLEFYTKNINFISKICEECEADATVAFFEKSSFKWAKSDFIHYIDLSNIKTKPISLCRKCSAKRITPSLEKYSGDFDEPIILPIPQEGVIISDEI